MRISDREKLEKLTTVAIDAANRIECVLHRLRGSESLKMHRIIVAPIVEDLSVALLQLRCALSPHPPSLAMASRGAGGVA